jgi:hypothetical protein
MKNIIFQIFLLEKVLSWYSRCDKEGKCTISETEDGEQIYLLPGYLPFYPTTTVTPIQIDTTKTSNPTNFSLQILTGYPKKGIFKRSKFNYECINGLDECVNSCCLDGFCKGTKFQCNKKLDEVELIYILTCCIFAVVILFYGVLYFILGCNYNKLVEKDNIEKEKAGYGGNIENVQNEKDDDDDEEIDHKNISHGTVQEENSNQNDSNYYNNQDKIDKAVRNIKKVQKKYDIEK